MTPDAAALQTNRKPQVAVCLAVYNGVQWLPEQLDSILGQDDVSVVLFVSVDVSTDGSESWVNQRAANDARIRVLPHGERFGGAAKNFFRLLKDVDFAGFDYVSFADQDDIWLPQKLRRAHQTLTSTGADAYSSNALAFWADGRRLLIEKAQPQVRWDFLFEAAGPGCTYVMRRAFACALQDLVRRRWTEVQQVGLHDWFAYAFARANGFSWIIDEYAGISYRQHDVNQVGVNHGRKALTLRVRKVMSGWGLSQCVLIGRLVGVGDSAFMKPWSSGQRTGLLWLALRARQCRRRTRDQLVFAFLCVILFLTGSRS